MKNSTLTRNKAILMTLVAGAILSTSQSIAQEAVRGNMLYENHCLQCHESKVHIREHRKVRSLLDLKKQVNRWANELDLSWQDEEIRDVSRYLNQTFYKFDSDERGNPMPIRLKSSAFEHNGEIPIQYTCDGSDKSPALSWANLPNGTKSLALIIDDPDAPDPAAPKMTWVHWVLYNIPADVTSLSEAIAGADLPSGTKQGLNDWKKTGYGGPCPPIGRHRYFHKLYALDFVLPDLNKPTKTVLEEAMQGHIIGQVELMGTYKRR